MFVVGLTGGIGSGKTAASDYLASKGIVVVDADVVAREVVEPGQPALVAIEAQFGGDVIQADGQLDRRALREIVFADSAARKTLEGITHPAIARSIMAQLQAATSAYAILASPLLLETSQKDMVNRVLLVDVPEAVQISRTTARDDVDEKQVRAIIAAQMARGDRRSRADDIVVNDSTLTDLHRQLDELHEDYLEAARD